MLTPPVSVIPSDVDTPQKLVRFLASLNHPARAQARRQITLTEIVDKAKGILGK